MKELGTTVTGIGMLGVILCLGEILPLAWLNYFLFVGIGGIFVAELLAHRERLSSSARFYRGVSLILAPINLVLALLSISQGGNDYCQVSFWADVAQVLGVQHPLLEVISLVLFVSMLFSFLAGRFHDHFVSS